LSSDFALPSFADFHTGYIQFCISYAKESNAFHPPELITLSKIQPSEGGSADKKRYGIATPIMACVQ